MSDLIDRQAIDKFIDGLEEIFADIRDRHIDDSVCGLCEYDGAYIGQSGDWCNECPGFDRDDCFKLSDKTRKKWTEEIIKALTPIQPATCEDAVSRKAVAGIYTALWETIGTIMDRDEWDDVCKATANELPSAQLGTNLAEVGTDCISRQAAIEALDEQIRQCDKALSSFDISIKDGFAVKVERASLVAFRETLEYLPPAQLDTYWKEQCQSYEHTINKLRESLSTQPEIIRCKDCKYWNSGSCEYTEHAVNCQDYWVGDIETEAEHFCGYAKRREVTT